MTSGIFYSTRSFLGREGKNVVRHLSLLSTCCDKIDHLSNTKTDTTKDYIMSHSSVKVNASINMFGAFYENVAVHMSTWMDIYEALNVECLADYDNLFIIGGMDLWRSDLTRSGRRANVFPNDSGQIKFRSVGVHCINILAMLKAHNLYKIPLHELAYDPNELNVGLFHQSVCPGDNYRLYHGYNIPIYNINRLDSLQHHFASRPKSLFTKDKTTELTFGYTILEKSGREDFKNDIMELTKQFPSHNLYVKDYQTGVDTTIDGDAYLDKLEESNYTFMLPSYDRHCFSGYRFIEALYHNCLPLIHPSCNVTDFEISYEIDLYDLMRTTPLLESKRLEWLEYLKRNIMVVERTFK